MPHPDKDTRKLYAAGIAFAVALLALLAFKTGLLPALGQMFVSKSTQHFQDVNKATAKPQTVVLKSGERIECKNVNNHGQFWGLVRADGKFSAVKKDDVSQIVTE